MTAIFAQPTADENLSPAWTVQGTGAAQATTGAPGAGYAQAANVGDITFASQVGAGGNSQAGSFAPYQTNVMENGSYTAQLANAPAGTNPTAIGALLTLTAAVTNVVLSGTALVYQTGTDVTYTIAGVTSADLTAGEIIPAGAKVTAPSGSTFVTTV
jgi:hypothetical protein